MSQSLSHLLATPPLPQAPSLSFPICPPAALFLPVFLLSQSFHSHIWPLAPVRARLSMPLLSSLGYLLPEPVSWNPEPVSVPASPPACVFSQPVLCLDLPPMPVSIYIFSFVSKSQDHPCLPLLSASRYLLSVFSSCDIWGPQTFLCNLMVEHQLTLINMDGLPQQHTRNRTRDPRGQDPKVRLSDITLTFVVEFLFLFFLPNTPGSLRTEWDTSQGSKKEQKAQSKVLHF